jgi:hypothetical protein
MAPKKNCFSQSKVFAPWSKTDLENFNSLVKEEYFLIYLYFFVNDSKDFNIGGNPWKKWQDIFLFSPSAFC